MAYEVLARKWRPQLFDDVVGQDHVIQTLKNAIKTNRIAHAYLFVGSRGTGKTSVARIFSKALNCEEGTSTEPCNKCDSCKGIVEGRNLDVIEIDGASNNSVDQVRELRETVKYIPIKCSFKIYIIDEVHMLSTAAFNALLKTLEEPPSYVKFIFATTEPEKILPTIVSRCQRFDFRRIPVSLIMDRLRLIAESEKIKVNDDALLAIARGAEGGLRDAESAFDQLVSFKGTEITEEDVLSVFGLVSRRTLEDLGENILNGDIRNIINTIATMDEAGKDLQRLVVELMGHFRNLLICLNIDDLAGDMDLTDAQINTLGRQAEITSTERVLRVTDILAEMADRMRNTLSKRILLETSLIRCARSAVVVSLEEILDQINILKGSLVTKKSSFKEEISNNEQSDLSLKLNKEEIQKDDGLKKTKNTYSSESKTEDILKIEESWKDILAKVGTSSIIARRSLLDAHPVAVNGDCVVIGFDPEFADKIQDFKSIRNRKPLERALEKILHRNIDVEFIIDSIEVGSKKKINNKVAEKKDSDYSVNVEDNGEDKINKNTKSIRGWIKDPAVQKVLEVFNGTIVEVRE